MATPTTITWLHLSDTHIGNPKYGSDVFNRFDGLFTDLYNLYYDHGLSPDVIFFTGDLVFGHHPKAISIENQFNSFNEFVDEVRNIYEPKINKKNIFFVPGNHEVNREVVTQDQTDWLHKWEDKSRINELIVNESHQYLKYLERLSYYEDFLKRNHYDHCMDNGKLSYTCLRQLNNLIISITGINTAWSSSGDNDQGKLWLGTEQLEKGILQSKNSEIKIVLSHHPCSWLTIHEKNEISRLIEMKFDFHLHGHEHENWIVQHNNLVKISSGCCYDSPTKDSGYNIFRVLLKDCRGNAYLRSYNKKSFEWGPEHVPKRTGTDGVWSIKDLPFAIKRAKFKKKYPDSNALIVKQPKKRIDIFKYFKVAKVQDDEKLFVGRRDEIRCGIGAFLAEGSSVVIFGKAGVGKSSLATQLSFIASGIYKDIVKTLGIEREIPSKGFHFPVVYYSCQVERDVDLPNIFASIIMDRTNFFSLGRLLSDKKVQDELNKFENRYYLSQLERVYSIDRKEQSLEFCVQLFFNLISVVREAKKAKSVVLVIDEFNVVKDKTGLASQIKSHDFVKFIISGTAPDVRILIRQHESISRQISEGMIKLNPMKNSECVEILDKEVEKSNGLIKFSNTSSREISKISKGMPFFVHFLGRYSIDEALRRSKLDFERPLLINIKDVQNVKEKRISQIYTLDADYIEIVNGKFNFEYLLHLLALQEDDEIDIDEIAEISKRVQITKSMCTRFINRLISSNVLNKIGDRHVEFIDNRLKVFIRLRKPIVKKTQNVLNDFYHKKLFKL